MPFVRSGFGLSATGILATDLAIGLLYRLARCRIGWLALWCCLGSFGGLLPNDATHYLGVACYANYATQGNGKYQLTKHENLR
jgi:hypothetical protein